MVIKPKYIYFLLWATVGIAGWLLGTTALRNDELLKEAAWLALAQRVWHKNEREGLLGFDECYVGGRKGAVVVVNREVRIGDDTYIAELGWTNSTLGNGVLMITAEGSFVWEEASGATQKVNIPSDGVPVRWYISSPLMSTE
jgi:hypothetical protein